MKYIKILVLILGLHSCFQLELDAQKKGQEDVIELENGSVVRGDIIMQNKDEVKIRLLGGSEFVFTMDEIVEIRQEEIYKAPKTFYKKDKGFYNVTQMGVMLGVDAQEGFSLETNNGYIIHPRFGAGLGIQLYEVDGHTFMPIYADLRGDFFPEDKVTPFWQAQIGYSLLLDRESGFNFEERAGLYYNYGIGLKFRTQGKVAINLTIGQQSQKYHSERFFPEDPWNNGEQRWVRDVWYNRLYIKGGISF